MVSDVSAIEVARTTLRLPAGAELMARSCVSLSSALDTTGVTLPWLRLRLFLVFAGIAGVAAAVLPARRAARLDVLTALSHE